MDSKQEQLVRRVMGFFTILFLVGALTFWLLPDQLITFLNSVGTSLGMKTTSVAQHNAMWVTLSVAMMIIITVLSYLAWTDPKKNINVFIPIVICKFTSSILGVYFFIFELRAFSNLAITLSDLPIALIVLWMYRITSRLEGAGEEVG